MEDVLETYGPPYDSQQPVICMDEPSYRVIAPMLLGMGGEQYTLF